eukprot:XP_766385.1 hypothetical protein [Theileria parva strain Muguga]
MDSEESEVINLESNSKTPTSHNERSVSKRHSQSLISESNSKLLHLGKTLLSYNTEESNKYAIDIATIFLSSIPPEGHIPQDLFNYIISIFHIYFKNESVDKIFNKFLTISAATSPKLRPLILEHLVRLLALKRDYSGIVNEVTRRCNEWNLEIHEVAKHYKWVVKHIETLTNIYPQSVPPDFIVELEDVLLTYLEYERLPNKNLLSLYTRICGSKSLDLINKYIAVFPRIYFLRFHRLKLLLKDSNSDKSLIEEDLIKFVELSGYSSLSVEFLNFYNRFVSTDKLIPLLFTTAVTVPHLKRNWDCLYKAIKNRRDKDTVMGTIKRSSLVSIFNIPNSIGRKITKKARRSFLTVASLFVDQNHLRLLTNQLHTL